MALKALCLQETASAGPKPFSSLDIMSYCRSWWVLRAQYRLLHCAGAALCLASLALFLFTDSAASQAPDAVLGDGLVLTGALLYAGCNVTQEKLLRELLTHLLLNPKFSLHRALM